MLGSARLGTRRYHKGLGTRRYHKGQHILLLTPKQIERQLKNAGSEGLRIDASKIHWTPFSSKTAM